MTLKSPTFVPIAAISSLQIAHRWDDYDPYPLLPDPCLDTEDRLSKLSDRAIVAFAIGCAEWVVYRFSELSDDPRPLQFVEACWAAEMSEVYATPDESEDEEWEGPIRGPIDLALMTVLNTFYAFEDDNAEDDAAFAELVALHVLPDTTSFLAWRDAVLDRLRATFPRKKRKPLGDPVPREMLDPTLSFDDGQRVELVKAFLTRLPKTSNPFLARTEE